MNEDARPRRVLDAVVGGHWRVGRPRTRWKDQVKEALTSLGVKEKARTKQRRQEEIFKAGRIPIIGLLWPHNERKSTFKFEIN